MSATDQQLLDALRDSYLRIVNSDASQWAEGARSMGYQSLKEMGDEIERWQKRIDAAAGRQIFFPMTHVNG